jgi:hypothetical protein
MYNVEIGLPPHYNFVYRANTNHIDNHVQDIRDKLNHATILKLLINNSNMNVWGYNSGSKVT